jgi:hypothetical protein
MALKYVTWARCSRRLRTKASRIAEIATYSTRVSGFSQYGPHGSLRTWREDYDKGYNSEINQGGSTIMDEHTNQVEDTTCDSCGRDLMVTYKDPLSSAEVKGMAPTMEMCLHLGPMPEDAVKKVYPELVLNHHYKVCMVCSLKALGVKLEDSRPEQVNRSGQEQAGRAPTN